jgi:hypothetical protein
LERGDAHWNSAVDRCGGGKHRHAGNTSNDRGHCGWQMSPTPPSTRSFCHGTTGLSVERRVFGGFACSYRDGTLAEYAAVEEPNLAPLPGDVEFTAAANPPISGPTAWLGMIVACTARHCHWGEGRNQPLLRKHS